jgi:hypothetical protein
MQLRNLTMKQERRDCYSECGKRSVCHRAGGNWPISASGDGCRVSGTPFRVLFIKGC